MASREQFDGFVAPEAPLRPPLIAKLIAPRPSQIVRRARVRTAIRRGLRTGACWITAPAGYGKTIAIADYLHTTLGGDQYRAPDLLRRLVGEGKLGKKSGEGFFRWDR